MFDFFVVSEHRMMKNENLWSIFLFFFLTQNGNETNPEIKKNNKSRYNTFPRNYCHLLLLISLDIVRVFLFQWKKIILFRMRSRKTSEKKGDSGEIGTNVWSKSRRRLL